MFFRTLIRRAAQEQQQGPYKAYLNPYKAKRLWPPDFSQLSQKHQFRLERRYRRRAKLKWARPQWTKFVKLVTWASIAVVGVYGVLFMETPGTTSIFDGIRGVYKSLGEGLFDNTPVRRDPAPQIDDAKPTADKE
ncbi:hypothetical protein AAFC00_000295 [Neodothiora populina]|uniref:Transmembrane protein n=1 Tax=Neodothiora populina TaxID=2781224 RepID=A0ABR3PCF3_9PEZI